MHHVAIRVVQRVHTRVGQAAERHQVLTGHAKPGFLGKLVDRSAGKVLARFTRARREPPHR